jgi:colicin import membrane protein
VKNKKTGKDGNMASKLKKTQLKRKEQYERRLNTRLALLSERKTEPSKIEKDPLVKNLRANIAATDARLKAIAKIEQRTAELAKIKAEKAEAAKAEKAAALGKPAEGGKEKGKDKGKDKEKEPKKAPAEGKEKKEKKKKSEADAT